MKYQFKIAVSVLLIAGLFLIIDAKSLAQRIGGADPLWLAGGMCSYFICQIVGAWRWRAVLAAGGVTIDMVRAIRINLAGLYASNFLPGVAGGDVLRPLYLFDEFPNMRGFLYASVIFERICGVASTLALAFLGGLAHALAGSGPAYLLAAGAAIFTLAAAVIVVRLSRNYFDLYSILPQRIRVPVQSAFDAWTSLARNRAVVLDTLLTTFLMQLLVVTMYWALVRSLGAFAEFSTVLFAASLAWLAATVPISFNGTGVREGVIAYFLIQQGIPGEPAIAGVFLGLVPMLLMSLLGAAVVGTYRLPSNP